MADSQGYDGGIDQNALQTDYNYRQSLRDAGYYVGDDGNGNVVAEGPSSPSNPSSSISGASSPGTSYQYSGSGGAMAADGQSLSSQDANTQATFRAVYGDSADQAWVQQHNAAIGAPNGSPSGASSPVGGQAQPYPGQPAPMSPTAQATSGFDWSSYYNAINQSNQQIFALQKQAAQDAHDKATQDLQLARNADDRAQAMLGIQQAQQDLAEVQQKEAAYEFQSSQQQQLGEFQQSQYTDLAKSLLNGAASLRGPQDWAQYVQYTNGGKSLAQTLFGNEVNPAFQAPAGFSNPITVGGVMNDLGFNQAGPSSNNQLDYVPVPTNINPATWDSLTPNAKSLTLGLAQSGYTPSGVITPDDYQRLIDAQRPVGSAGGTTTFNYPKPPASSF